MRILHFFKTYYPDTTGGIEQVIFQLSQGCRALGVEAKVLALSPDPHPPQLTIANHEVTRARETLNLASTGLSIEVFKRYREMAAEADIVHFHFPWPMMDVVHFASRIQRPAVLSYHSDIVKQRMLLKLYAPLMTRFLGSMDRILVASPNYQASSPWLNRFRDKTVLVPYGLDESSYPEVSSQRQRDWKARLPERFFLFVGTLRYYKGLSILLNALGGMDYPVVILGSGPEEQKLKEQARQLQLHNLYFLSRLGDEDKVCLLQMCHALVFPSHLRSEAFGISLLEAAMYSKPMISCEIGTGTTFVNLHGETGLVVPPNDPPALSKALQQLWHDAPLAARLGRNARQRFEQLFTAERMCATTVDIYQQLLSR